mmetsp:Transcript_9781/g.24163  ORF Transcript_9781/g.24163 Transcript_9781/m.24163 type:complete len:212 (+) Transcript_9781:2620-3255(+)
MLSRLISVGVDDNEAPLLIPFQHRRHQPRSQHHFSSHHAVLCPSLVADAAAEHFPGGDAEGEPVDSLVVQQRLHCHGALQTSHRVVVVGVGRHPEPNHRYEAFVVYSHLLKVPLEPLHLALDDATHVLNLLQEAAILLRRIQMQEQNRQTTQLSRGCRTASNRAKHGSGGEGLQRRLEAALRINHPSVMPRLGVLPNLLSESTVPDGSFMY